MQVSLYGIEGQGLGPRCALLAVSDFREEEGGAMTVSLKMSFVIA